MTATRLIKNLAFATPVVAMSLLLANCQEPANYSYLFDQAQNNTTPVAIAGPDQLVPVGSEAVLDGTGSYDPDDEEIEYHWRFHEKPDDSVLTDTSVAEDGHVSGGPFSINNDRNAVRSSFTPDVEGVYTFGLVVSDASGTLSESDFVVIRVASALDLPVADAGPNQSTFEGTEVCLDGSNSHDPAQRELVYRWDVVTVPDLSLIEVSDLVIAETSACFTPDAPGSFAISLVVENGIVESDPDFAFVAVGSTNQGPTAIAEVTRAYSCDFVEVTGINSTDPEGDPLNYDWEMLRVPNGSVVETGDAAFEDNEIESPRFYADVSGTYTVQLVVNDGEGYSAPVFLEFDLEENSPTNLPPDVVVTPDAYLQDTRTACSFDAYNNCLNCPSCSNVNFELSSDGTIDPDGDAYEVTWDIIVGPGGTTLTDQDDDPPVVGEQIDLTVPGPSGSCSSALTTHTVQIQATATDCDGDAGTALFTVVYDCIAN